MSYNTPTKMKMNPGKLEVDFVVHNVQAKVKELENKFMNLANFYKEIAKEKGAKFYSKLND